MTYSNEAQLELATVDYFRELGYEYIHGAHIAPACLRRARHGRQAVKPAEAIKAVRKV